MSSIANSAAPKTDEIRPVKPIASGVEIVFFQFFGLVLLLASLPALLADWRMAAATCACGLLMLILAALLDIGNTLKRR